MLDNNCSFCTNNEMISNNSLLKTASPKFFPTAISMDDDGLLSPMHLSYDILKECAALAHENYVCGSWSIDNVKQYLCVHCLNNDTVSAVMQHAVNGKNFKTLDENKLENNAAYNILSLHKEKNPYLYEHWPYPALWTRGMVSYQHIDVPMHLLFLE
jgi:hypothetical protein